ncbi:lysozyme inhibitor LprI family protein [Neisseriaceae bacterium B1]
MKKTLIAALCASMALAACSDKAADNQAASAASAAAQNICAQPTLNEQIRASIQKSISDTARNFASQDARQWVDADKVVAAATELNIQVNNAQTNQQNCQTQVSIAIPSALLDTVKANAPLLQAPVPSDYIAESLQGSNARFENNTITFPLNYTQPQNGANNLNTTDNNLSHVGKILANALLPYGIKDTINVQGQTLSRQEALQKLQSPAPKQPETTASMPATLPKMEEIEPIGNDVPAPPRPEELSASGITSNATEVLQPTAPAKANVSDGELAQAREANQTADQSIKSAWKKIDPEIQKSLVDEQRNWESKKRQSCRSAGAKGADAAEIQYLQMQCDTRLTRERVQYLNGYSID